MPARLQPPYHCSMCGVELTAENSIRDRKLSSGLRSNCAKCHSDRKKAQYTADQAYRASMRHKLRTYHIDEATFYTMLDHQDHRCAICKEPFLRDRDIHIDHCHETQRVRGLLCPRCNTLLGHVETVNGRQWMMRVEAYLGLF